MACSVTHWKKRHDLPLCHGPPVENHCSRRSRNNTRSAATSDSSAGYTPGPSLRLRSRGAKNCTRGPHFQIQNCMYAATGGTNIKLETHIFNGGPGTTGLTAGDGPAPHQDGTKQGRRCSLITPPGLWKTSATLSRGCTQLDLPRQSFLRHSGHVGKPSLAGISLFGF